MTESHKEESFLPKINKNSNLIKSILFVKEKSLEKYYENEPEYKLVKDSWKIITKSKTFNEEKLGSSRRVLLFFLIVCGVYKRDINNSFLKKEFPFLLEEDKINLTEINISVQIYRYFYLFRSSILKISAPNIKENKKNNVLNNNDSANIFDIASKSFIKSNTHFKKIINNNSAIINKKRLIPSKTIIGIKSFNNVTNKLKMNNNTLDEINKTDNNINYNFKNNKKSEKGKNKIKNKIIYKINNSLTRNIYISKTQRTDRTHNKYTENENNSNKSLKRKISKINTLNNNTIKYKINSNILKKKNLNISKNKFISIKDNNIFTKPTQIKEDKIQQNNDFQKHDKEKESFMNNYILNENYRIKEDIKTGGNLNNFMEESSVKKPTKDVLDEYYFYNLKNFESSDSKYTNKSNQYSNNKKNINNIRNGNIPTGAKTQKNRFVFKIKVNREMIRLVIFRGENYELKLDEFCQKNNLDKDDKQQLLEAIKLKLEE